MEIEAFEMLHQLKRNTAVCFQKKHLCTRFFFFACESPSKHILQGTKYSYGLFTIAIFGTRTGTGTRTSILQKPFTMIVCGTRTGHLNAIEI